MGDEEDGEEGKQGQRAEERKEVKEGAKDGRRNEKSWIRKEQRLKEEMTPRTDK